LPVGLATFFARIQPVLEEAGFQTAVVADAPAFGSNMRWSHILLLNRSAGERAGVTSWVEGNSLPLLGLTFAVQFADGECVVTDAAEFVGQTPWQVPIDASAAADLARRVYSLHRARSAQLAGREGTERVMPQEGKELEWVQEKAGAVAAAHAAEGLERDPSGHYFRPTRRHAVRMVARDFRMVPVPKPKPVPPGFPVSLAGPPEQTPGKP
jgi:hypothetical protein